MAKTIEFESLPCSTGAPTRGRIVSARTRSERTARTGSILVRRFGPLITPESHPAAGANINGPSLLRVPDWVEWPLGRHHLYFADHKGDSIRLAYADDVAGPYTLHPAER